MYIADNRMREIKSDRGPLSEVVISLRFAQAGSSKAFVEQIEAAYQDTYGEALIDRIVRFSLPHTRPRILIVESLAS